MRNNRAPHWRLAVTVLVSALLHVSLGVFLSTVLTMPSVDMEFQVPLDVEFGMTDQVASVAALPGSAGANDANSAPKAPPAETLPAGSEPEKPKKKPKAPEEAPDTTAAGKTSDPPLPGKETKAQLPAGTQIAVRVDMARIRQSPIAEDVRSFLAAVPDWKALLDGSGIDPVADLDRFMIATPNLQRSKIVVAGRYVGTEQTVFDAVQRLADSRGETAPWHADGGVRVAKWANPDETPRVIALVGPSHFTISREEDLPRVLAVAVARAEAQKARKRPTEGQELPAEALLSMEKDEGISIEVEGAEKFVRRASRGVPAKLRLSAVELPGPRLELRGLLTFGDTTKAEEGALFWDNLRNAYADNALVSMLGLAQPLKDASVTRSELEVRLTVSLSVQQAQLILGYLRELVRPPVARDDNAGATLAPSPAAQGSR